MTYLPRIARVLAFASVHMLTPAWGQAHEAPMTRANLTEAQPARAALVKADLMRTNVAMTEIAKANGIRVVLASVTPVCDCFDKAAGRRRWQERITEVNELIEKYCAQSGAVYLDYYSAMVQDRKKDDDNLKKDLTTNGVVPNDAGYSVMAPLAARAVSEALKK